MDARVHGALRCTFPLVSPGGCSSRTLCNTRLHWFQCCRDAGKKPCFMFLCTSGRCNDYVVPSCPSRALYTCVFFLKGQRRGLDTDWPWPSPGKGLVSRFAVAVRVLDHDNAGDTEAISWQPLKVSSHKRPAATSPAIVLADEGTDPVSVQGVPSCTPVDTCRPY